MEEMNLKKYANIMREIKFRVNTLIVNIHNSPDDIINIESRYLQIRKVLELISLASLVANEDEFKKHSDKYNKMYNARLILQDIKRINPNYYPQPIREYRNENKNMWVNRKDGFLTEKEFVKLYEKCGKLMHAQNPFSTPIDYAKYQLDLPNWIDKIMVLLNSHTIQLIDSNDVYLIHMQEDGDDEIHYYTFKAVKKEESI